MFYDDFPTTSVFVLLSYRLHSVLFIRTSNFGAEAERSYIFLRFEAENVLKMFLTTWYTLHVFQ